MRILSLAALLLAPVVSAAAPVPRNDGQGSPLPEHAVARFGTLHFRHGGTITALDVSRDGKYVVSGGHDRTVRVWDAETGKLLRSFTCDAPYPTGAVFSPDGKFLAAYLDSENVSIVEWAKPDAKPLALKAAVAQSIAWSPDGKSIACAATDEDAALIYNAADGKLRHKVKGAARVEFLADGKSFAVGTSNNGVRIHDTETAKELAKFPAPEGAPAVTDLRRVPGKDLLVVAFDTTSVSALNAGTISVWDVKAVKALHTFAAVGPLAVTADGETVAAASENRVVLFDLKTAVLRSQAAAAGHGVPLAFAPDGNRLFVGGPEYRVRVWNLTNGKEQSFGGGHAGEARAVAFGPGGKTLFSAGSDGFRLWDVAGRREIAAARRANPAQALLLAPDARRLFTAGPRAVELWEPVDLSQAKPYPERPSLLIPAAAGPGVPLALAPTGDLLAFTNGKKLALADPARGTAFPGLAFPAEPLAAAFGPNGRNLAVITRDGLLHFWSLGRRPGTADAPADLELWRKRVQRSPRAAVAVSPDGLLVAASSAGRVLLLDAVRGQPFYGFDRQLGDGDVQALAFSPDGRLIAAAHGGPEGVVRVWELATRKEVVTFRGHLGGINAIAFDPRGTPLASAGADSTVLLWDLTLPREPGAKALAPAEAWESLDNEEAGIAYAAMGALIREGPRSVAVIRDGLAGAAENQQRIRAAIKRLEDDDFRNRKTARTFLEKEGLRAAPAISKALAKKKLAPDAERLLRLIVEGMEARGLRVPEAGLFGEPLRAARAVQVLERVGGADAVKALEALATGPGDDRVAAEAKAALERVKR
jgi:WD40 repeat protein